MESRSREFVRYVFLLGKEACSPIKKGVEMTSGGKVEFPLSDDNSFEIAIATLGTTLFILKHYSKVTTLKEGMLIESCCKQSLREDYGLSSDDVEAIIRSIDNYQGAFNKAVTSKVNPFFETTSLLLTRCLGNDVLALCLDDRAFLNPLVQETIGGSLMLYVSHATKFWSLEESQK